MKENKEMNLNKSFIFSVLKSNDFTKYITIENSRITFFEYGNDDV